METSKQKIMIIENLEELKHEIKSSINASDYAQVVCEYDNALDGLKYLETNSVDAVVTELLLPQLDAFAFLERLQEKYKGNAPKVIVLSAISGDDLVGRAFELGASYFMIKPIDYEVLNQRIKDTITRPRLSMVETKVTRSKSLEEKITNIFITVGIPAHIKGYQFLREAIMMAIETPSIINSITKQLYPSIAQRFDTSASKVERAIRHAIEVAWNRGKIENINNIFGIRVYSSNEKPTNGEFIALVADKMLIEGA